MFSNEFTKCEQGYKKMPRTTLALTSFVSGEFSAKMDGRTDFEKYSSGVKTMENFLVHPQGAATRRVGTQHIAEVKDSTKKTRLIPFEFSTTQTYILEFGDQYIRFFKDKGQILSSGGILMKFLLSLFRSRII